MREWLARLWDWLRRNALTAELDEELRFHRQQLERDARAAGADPVDATRIAERALGRAVRWREQARDRWSWPWLDQLQQDTRFALRSLRRTPLFAVSVIVTLALGLGANAAMFAVISRMMLRLPPYLNHPNNVNRVYLSAFDQGQVHSWHNFEYRRYHDFARLTSSFDETAGFVPASIVVGSGADAQEIETEAVSASFWNFFSARPVLGRFFTESEDRAPDGALVAVISSTYWKTRLGGRADVIGTALRIGALRCTIVGVAPDGFVGISDGRSPALVFIPIATVMAAYGEGVDGLVISIPDQYFNYGGLAGVEMLVRRKAGAGSAAATADLTNAFRLSYQEQRSLDTTLPQLATLQLRAAAGPLQTDRCILASAQPCDSYGPQGKIALCVAGLALLVLLIACANVANLVFARIAGRKREIAMRLALGITRGRLARQLIVESLFLAILATAAGLLVAEWTSAALQAMFLPKGEALPIVGEPMVIIFALGVGLAAGIATGLIPAMKADRGDLARTLRGATRQATLPKSRLRLTLVGFQAALSVVLLIGAGLFLRSLSHARAVPLGYDIDPLLFGFVNLRGKSLTAGEKSTLASRLVDDATSIPGVIGASVVASQGFRVNGMSPLAIAGLDTVSQPIQAVSPGHFHTIGTRLLRGREFTPLDRRGAPSVVVVNEAMARRLWPGKDPLGQCLRVGGGKAPCATVIGVAENMKEDGLFDIVPSYFIPIDQLELTSVVLRVFVRTSGSSRHYAEVVRQRLQRLLSSESLISIMAMGDVAESNLRQWALGSTMLVVLGGLALVLGAVGLYSVISYGIAERAHELGVRVALGARSTNIVRLVVGEGIRLVTVGIAIGCLLALAASAWVEPLLFEQSPRDPIVFGAVGGGLLFVAMVAGLIPALRASRVDPNVTLRSD